MHFILDAVSAQHHINTYLNMLRVDSTLTLVNAPELPLPVAVFSLIPFLRNFARPITSGIAETQEILDCCGDHNIVSDIELLKIEHINEAYECLMLGVMEYCFVVDIVSL